MKMTPTVVLIGSLCILGAVVFIVVFLPYVNRDETPSEIFRESVFTVTASRFELSIGDRVRKGLPRQEIMFRTGPYSSDPSEPDPIFPRKAENTRMTGT